MAWTYWSCRVFNLANFVMSTTFSINTLFVKIWQYPFLIFRVFQVFLNRLNPLIFRVLVFLFLNISVAQFFGSIIGDLFVGSFDPTVGDALREIVNGLGSSLGRIFGAEPASIASFASLNWGQEQFSGQLGKMPQNGGSPCQNAPNACVLSRGKHLHLYPFELD